ncbi:MAG: DUF4381 domain-containing protein [Nitrosomonas sp.]|nr:DUF4381 domain-containing protein [Nitrosomonas sp.]MDP1950936.1 DUF4381 domain-containing protein [Nitrosomonas sp.]
MMEDPLAALRPLHAPAPITWWPPAPGWWMILLIIVALLIIMYRYWRCMAPRRAALRELKLLRKNKNTTEPPVATLNQLLKRYALVCWPSSSVASLSGKAWLEFLDSHGGNGKFSDGPGRILLTNPYQKQSAELNELTVLARRWIKSNRPGKITDV